MGGPPLICDVNKEGGLTGGPRALVSPGHPARPRRLRMSTFCLVVSEACHLADLGYLTCLLSRQSQWCVQPPNCLSQDTLSDTIATPIKFNGVGSWQTSDIPAGRT